MTSRKRLPTKHQCDVAQEFTHQTPIWCHPRVYLPKPTKTKLMPPKSLPTKHQYFIHPRVYPLNTNTTSPKSLPTKHQDDVAQEFIDRAWRYRLTLRHWTLGTLLQAWTRNDSQLLSSSSPSSPTKLLGSGMRQNPLKALSNTTTILIFVFL